MKKGLYIQNINSDRSFEFVPMQDKLQGFKNSFINSTFINQKTTEGIAHSLANNYLLSKDFSNANLIEIIDELYLKIEDVIIVIKQQPEFEKEKEKMNKEAQDGQENVFTQGYDKDNVVDISTTLIKKKRKRSEDTKNKEDQK